MPDRRFADPPITEVVCGVLFTPAEGLDPVLVGRFWELHRARFPHKQLQPAILSAMPYQLVLEISPIPQLRTWLLSEDDSRVMQIQADRFYLNWRSRGTAYPSFNKSGEDPGLLTEVLAEFSSFASFMKNQVGQELQLLQVEMSMVDVFKQGRHWGTIRDLERLVPAVKAFIGGADRLPATLDLRVDGVADDHEQGLVIQKATIRESGTDAVRIHTTARLPVQSAANLEGAFKKAHTLLKRRFDELVPGDEHHRFDSSEWRPSS